MIRPAKYPAIITLLLFLAATSAFAKARRVVILPISGGFNISDTLIIELTRFKDIEIVPDNEVVKIIMESQIQEKDFYEPFSLKLIGQKAKANYVIYGRTQKIGKTIRISSAIFKVSLGKVVNQYALSGLLAEQKRLAQRLAFMIVGPKYYAKPIKSFTIIDPKNSANTFPDPSFYKLQLEEASLKDITFVGGITFPININQYFWLPGGKTILGVVEGDANRAIAEINVTDGSFRVLQATETKEDIISLSLSPDLKTVAYSTPKTIFLTNFDGSGKCRKLTAGVYPSWSSDGKKIAYNDSPLFRNIFIIELQNRKPQKFYSGGIPLWLPDGREIVVRHKFDDSFSLNIISDLFIKRSLTGEDVYPILPLFSKPSYSGPKIPISPNGRFFLGNVDSILTIQDLRSGEVEEIKVGGKPIEVGKSNVAWESDGNRIAFKDAADPGVFTIAEMGFKDKILIKINAGRENGLLENQKISLVRSTPKFSPLTDRIFMFSEKYIATMKLGKVYQNISYATASQQEIKEIDKSLIVKYYTMDKSQKKLNEASIMVIYDSAEALFQTEDKNAKNLFKKASEAYDVGNLDKAYDMYQTVSILYPSTDISKQAISMMELIKP